MQGCFRAISLEPGLGGTDRARPSPGIRRHLSRLSLRSNGTETLVADTHGMETRELWYIAQVNSAIESGNHDLAAELAAQATFRRSVRPPRVWARAGRYAQPAPQQRRSQRPREHADGTAEQAEQGARPAR